MRFLANENFPGRAVTALAAAGHDVVWVTVAAPGMSDADVLAWAARDERILLTFDKDFGAPRSMMMGNTRSPSRYEAALRSSIKPP
jgi:predicted nuclease of predicted toxin-antitoxin system